MLEDYFERIYGKEFLGDINPNTNFDPSFNFSTIN